MTAVAMATSKWLDAPIMATGAASSYESFSARASPYPIPKTSIVCIKRGTAIVSLLAHTELPAYLWDFQSLAQVHVRLAKLVDYLRRTMLLLYDESFLPLGS